MFAYIFDHWLNYYLGNSPTQVVNFMILLKIESLIYS